jgi:hypothetical protein
MLKISEGIFEKVSKSLGSVARVLKTEGDSDACCSLLHCRTGVPGQDSKDPITTTLEELYEIGPEP